MSTVTNNFPAELVATVRTTYNVPAAGDSYIGNLEFYKADVQEIYTYEYKDLAHHRIQFNKRIQSLLPSSIYYKDKFL